MNTVPPPTADELRLLTDISRHFYIDDVSKVELAKQYGISRFRVARLLKEAKALGIVKITIQHPFGGDSVLAASLAEHLNLDEVYLSTANADIIEERNALGLTAANYLVSMAKNGDRIGFSWGRTLLPMVRHLNDLPPAEIIQVSGMVGNDPSQSPIEMLAQFSANQQLTTKALFAPLFSTTTAAADAVRHEPAVAEVISRLDGLDFAFLSVGSWDPPINQLVERMTAEEITDLNAEGVVAEVVGMFFNEDGEYIDTPMNARRISLSPEQLRATDHVVAVAGQLGKTRAIRSICASGLVNCLVTTDEVASALMNLPPLRSGRSRH